MKYTVVWTQFAEAALADLWTTANPDTRPLLSLAIERIERELQLWPESAGESRATPVRILIVIPVVILFEVHPLDRIVKVIDVRLVRKKQ